MSEMDNPLPPGSAGERRNFLPAGNDAFTCLACGCEVLPLAAGGFRNHCPRCLWSRHVDRVPGDRSEACGGMLRPVELQGSPGSGWYIVHLCVSCGARRRSRTAENDPRQPDRWERIVELSSRAME
jgi:hypothetical protein